jgi:formate dehydrogenase subunit beta
VKTGHRLPIPQGMNKALSNLLKTCLDERLFEAVFLPMPLARPSLKHSPEGVKGYNYVLVQDSTLLEHAEFMPPVMPVQGGKALFSLTRHGKSEKIAAIMRPCEIRAAIELSKLHQTDLENIFFVSMDCPGVIPLSDYINNETNISLPSFKGDKIDAETFLRPLCQICDHFSLTDETDDQVMDLHVGTIGLLDESMLMIPVSAEAEEILKTLGLNAEEDTDDWLAKIREIQAERRKVRQKALSTLQTEIRGLDGVLQAFSQCIGCRNCGSVCPICYCRLCFAEKSTLIDTADDYLQRTDLKGAMQLFPEPLLFHLGRMAHMSVSCVSCGMCEDACPVDIPVGRIFSLVGEATQEIFDYIPGSEQELPLKRFELEELTEIEDK